MNKKIVEITVIDTTPLKEFHIEYTEGEHYLKTIFAETKEEAEWLFWNPDKNRNDYVDYQIEQLKQKHK
jgi:ABC-type microcin C transport system permease subunit YejE